MTVAIRGAGGVTGDQHLLIREILTLYMARPRMARQSAPLAERDLRGWAMTFDLTSTLVGFLVGAATGAAGTYLANKYTDRRREKEADTHVKRRFLAVKEQMPELIAEMKSDLAGDGNSHIREFFVLPNKRVRLGGSEKPRFIYYEDQHENLRGKLDVLENEGYIMDVTPKNTPIFRMSEEFVELLMKFA
jgi:hypothetical protein